LKNWLPFCMIGARKEAAFGRLFSWSGWGSGWPPLFYYGVVN
jgi:hypothetical protein